MYVYVPWLWSVLVTTVEVDGSYQLEVGVDPANTVDISTVLQAWTHRRLVQVPGLTPYPVTHTLVTPWFTTSPGVCVCVCVYHWSRM